MLIIINMIALYYIIILCIYIYYIACTYYYSCTVYSKEEHQNLVWKLSPRNGPWVRPWISSQRRRHDHSASGLSRSYTSLHICKILWTSYYSYSYYIYSSYIHHHASSYFMFASQMAVIPSAPIYACAKDLQLCVCGKEGDEAYGIPCKVPGYEHFSMVGVIWTTIFPIFRDIPISCDWIEYVNMFPWS
jgi:hypothetical protein